MSRPRSPIEQMVDRACGFDPSAEVPKLVPTAEELRHWSSGVLADYLRALAVGVDDKEIALVLREAARRVVRVG